MEGQQATVVFFPEGAYGPTNNCVGIAAELRRRGVRVVFVIEESFKGTLTEKGFEEQLMRLKPKPAVEEVPGQFRKDFIRDTAPEFRKSTIDALETLTRPIWSELISGSMYVNDRLESIFQTVQPDVIRRLIELLGRTDYRVIVSMGPQHHELRLADNMIGAEFLPQTSILPLVDLVITHGGNNTVTESLHFGKPMIVLPLFWDQPDNAQRIQETGFGVRLDPYAFAMTSSLVGSTVWLPIRGWLVEWKRFRPDCRPRLERCGPPN